MCIGSYAENTNHGNQVTSAQHFSDPEFEGSPLEEWQFHPEFLMCLHLSLSNYLPLLKEIAVTP